MQENCCCRGCPSLSGGVGGSGAYSAADTSISAPASTEGVAALGRGHGDHGVEGKQPRTLPGSMIITNSVMSNEYLMWLWGAGYRRQL